MIRFSPEIFQKFIDILRLSIYNEPAQDGDNLKIRLANLSEDILEDIPEWVSPPYSCKYCLYWEFPAENKELTKKAMKNIMAKKLAWLKQVQNNFGDCGSVLYVDEQPIGYAQYAPSKFMPNLVNYPILPSLDVVFISCLFIFDKKYRRAGFGTVLLCVVLENLGKRGIKAVETIARKGSPINPTGPVEFYLENEFIIYKDHKEFPLMRLELQ